MLLPAWRRQCGCCPSRWACHPMLPLACRCKQLPSCLVHATTLVLSSVARHAASEQRLVTCQTLQEYRLKRVQHWTAQAAAAAKAAGAPVMEKPLLVAERRSAVAAQLQEADDQQGDASQSAGRSVQQLHAALQRSHFQLPHHHLKRRPVAVRHPPPGSRHRMRQAPAACSHELHVAARFSILLAARCPMIKRGR